MASEFPWRTAESEASHAYLLPTVLDVLSRRIASPESAKLLDIGSGNGSLTAAIAERYPIMGLEPSAQGIEQARRAFPSIPFERGDAYEDLRARFGTFDAIVSCEVIEHLLMPTEFLKRAHAALAPGGVLIVSTPYHGYLKNLLLAVAGKWDFHHHPEREYGHVKFFSRQTINQVAGAAGFREAEFHRVGRWGPIAKSMISVFEHA